MSTIIIIQNDGRKIPGNRRSSDKYYNESISAKPENFANHERVCMIINAYYPATISRKNTPTIPGFRGEGGKQRNH